MKTVPEKIQKSILVADDDESTRLLIQKVLEGSDYKVLLAENGEVALNLLKSSRVDLLILDYMMPVKGGDEVLAELGHLNIDLPVVMLTSKGEKEVIIETISHGATDFIVKPFDTRIFNERIRCYLIDFSEGDIRQILTMLRFPDLSLLRFPQIAREAGKNKDIYAFNFEKFEFFALLNHEMKGSSILALSMAEIAKNLTIFVKGAARWHRVWPRKKEIEKYDKEFEDCLKDLKKP